MTSKTELPSILQFTTKDEAQSYADQRPVTWRVRHGLKQKAYQTILADKAARARNGLPARPIEDEPIWSVWDLHDNRWAFIA
jgi:hypothetical protein